MKDFGAGLGAVAVWGAEAVTTGQTLSGSAEVAGAFVLFVVMEVGVFELEGGGCPRTERLPELVSDPGPASVDLLLLLLLLV